MTIEFTISRGRRWGKKLAGQVPAVADRPPRIAYLLALAHRFDALVRSGTVNDYAELARLGHVTRARVTQIMNLLTLAPDIQESLLFLSSKSGCVTERDLRRISAEVRWDRQRAQLGRRTKAV